MFLDPYGFDAEPFEDDHKSATILPDTQCSNTKPKISVQVYMGSSMEVSKILYVRNAARN